MAAERAAIVSGAAKGIGRACAERLATLGHPVVCLDVDSPGTETMANEIRDEGGEALGVDGDVSQPEDVEWAVNRCVDRFGPPGVVVNNAGIQTHHAFLDLPVEDWDRVHEVNLKGMFLLGQRAAASMIEDGVEGRIVNISSIHDSDPRSGKVHYDTSKAGVLMLTREMALALAEHGIRVNCVAPGAVTTPMNDDLLDDEAAVSEVAAGVPLGRVGEPADVADVVEFLVGERASYLTGVRIPVDGGRELI